MRNFLCAAIAQGHEMKTVLILEANGDILISLGEIEALSLEYLGVVFKCTASFHGGGGGVFQTGVGNNS